MPSKRRLTAAELAAWRRVTRNLTPLERPDFERVLDEVDEDVVARTTGPGTSKAGKTPAAKDSRAPGIDHSDTKPKRSGIAHRGNEKRIRRGRTDVTERIDLHGMTQDRAKVALMAFVVRARENRARSALVITGKGRNGQGVLKAKLVEWISHPEFRVHVSGWANAHQRHGGEGAYYVFLRANVGLD